MSVPFQTQAGRGEKFFLRGGTPVHYEKNKKEKKNILWLEHATVVRIDERQG